MKVTVSESAEVRLEDPEVFDDLRVVIEGGDTEVAAAALASYGELAADQAHMFLAPDALPRLAGASADDPAWRERYDGMVGYAASHGWVDDRGRIRAHVERA